MAKGLSDHILLGQTLSIRVSGRQFLNALGSSLSTSDSYLDSLEITLALLADYAEEHGWPNVSDITTEHIEEYLVYLAGRPRWFGRQGQGTISRTTIERHYRSLRRFWGWLLDRGYIDANPVVKIPHPKLEQRMVPTVSQEDIRKLLDQVDIKLARTPAERFRSYRNKAVLLVLTDTPGRRAEITGLTLPDIDLEEGIVRVVGKGMKERAMPLGNAARQALWEYVQARNRVAPDHNDLWVNTQGQPMAGDWLYRMLRRLGRRIGLEDLHPHQFRHTYAIAAINANMPLEVLKWTAGWSGQVPRTYFQTVGVKEAIKFHRLMSPADAMYRETKPAPRARPPKKRRL